MTTVNRRKFLKSASAGGVGVATAAIAAPAIAQSSPEIKWRLTSSFPKSLDTLYGAAETFAKAVSEATDASSRSPCSPVARSCRPCKPPMP